MNVLFVIIDSLDPHFLAAYGRRAGMRVLTPHLEEFARHARVFERHHAGGLHFLSARREFLAGTQEFLWRPPGPLEPFDRPLLRLASEAGVMTHLVTDQHRYFQHGGRGYLEDSHGWEFERGARVEPGSRPATAAEWSTARVFDRAAEWLERNVALHDPWLLLVDVLGPVEPRHAAEPYSSWYVDDDPEEADAGGADPAERRRADARAQYAAKLTMTDRWLGRLFERLDDFGLWDDTMVVVTSDHGHCPGAALPPGRGPTSPARAPLIVWHPGQAPAGRVTALTSAVDLYATCLEALGVPTHRTVHARCLLPLVLGEAAAHREWALFGSWGGGVSVTDGRHTYYRSPDPRNGNRPLYAYSTMMLNQGDPAGPPSHHPSAVAGQFLPYAFGPCWRYPAPDDARPGGANPDEAGPLRSGAPTAPPAGQALGNRLFDAHRTPDRQRDLRGRHPEIEARMVELLRRALRELEAPEEQFERLGL